MSKIRHLPLDLNTIPWSNCRPMDGLIALLDTAGQSRFVQTGMVDVLLLLALVATGLAANWRLSAAGVGIIALCTTLLLFGAIAPLLAAARLITGMCVMLILLNATWGRRNQWRLRYPRLGLVLISLLLVYALTQSGILSLPIADSLSLGVYALIVIGVGLLVSAEHLLYSIIGLFLVLVGADLVIATITESSTLTMLFAAIQIALALLTAWIATPPESQI